MIKLDTNYKIKTAQSLTELAIQNNLIPRYSEDQDTAKAVCTFFKTIFDELDSDSEE